MRKTLVGLSLLFAMAFNLNAHAVEKPEESANSTWTFIAVSVKPTAEDLAQVTDEGDFGKEATYLYNKLEQLCVKRVPVVPGDPTTRIVFTKGDIYNAVRRIGKGLEDDVKSHTLTSNEASKKMLNVLNVALSAFYTDDSKSFEKALRANKKDYNKLLAVFNSVSLNNY